MNRTKIDWPFPNLYTWNPIFGCLNNCPYCYAKKMAIRFRGGFAPRFDEHIFNDPDIKKKKPRSIFIGSMADMFGSWVPDCQIQRVLDKANKYPWHKYVFLTKNPARYLKFDFKGLDCWLGMTKTKGENFRTYDGVVMVVKQDQGAKTFLSIEPLLGPWHDEFKDAFDLIIVGAMTGQRKPAPIPQEWIDSIKHPRIYWKKSIRHMGNINVPTGVSLKTNIKTQVRHMNHTGPWRPLIETLPKPLLSPHGPDKKNGAGVEGC